MEVCIHIPVPPIQVQTCTYKIEMLSVKYWECFRLLGNLQLSWVVMSVERTDCCCCNHLQNNLLLTVPILNPWMHWLQNPSAAMTVKFGGGKPLEILPFVHEIPKAVLDSCQNLLEYLCPAVLSFQLILGSLKSPVSTRACKGEAVPVCL